ncbi:MAG: hypothetical protein Q7S22_07355 [Candidatus Micrarchaeota archaeon]|nr:hypothetical protein [Candidatus Micrarchaeota archaeon]
MSLESLLFSNIQMPGELVRIALAILGTAAVAYFDIFNNRNIPNNFLYVFLGVSILTNIVFFDQDIFVFAAIIAVFLSLWGYLFYRVGHFGGADVFVLASLTLLLPIPPSFTHMPFNMPFIFVIFLFALILSSLYSVVDFAIKLTKKNAKPNMIYFALLIPYALFVYMFSSSPFFSLSFLIIISISLIATIFFAAYREDILKLQAQKIPMSKVTEEDVLAIELMDKDTVWLHSLKKLITTEELKRLRKLKLQEVWVYTKLLPFLPFVFLGLLLSLVFANYLFY